VFVAIGAGHAFKFASLLGRTLAELAVDGATRTEIGPFRFGREILGRENPERNFMT
jgi:sarcosine oxidase